MVGFITDTGNVRKLNEDFLDYYEDEEKGIYVVADGMGGHNAGEVASKIAVNTIIDYIKNNFKKEKEIFILTDAIKSANREIYNYARNNENLKGMGTTVVVAFACNDSVFIANVGDSSCYAIKDGTMRKVTRDHSLVQQLLDEGTITQEQAIKHPNRNIITRAVGTNEEVVPDIYELEKDEFGCLLLCTDGLTNELSKEEILKICLLHEEDYDVICSELVDLTKSRGAKDNVSLLIFGGERYDNRNSTRG